MLPMTLAALQTGQVPGAVISNGTVSLGVHNLGHLNYGGTGVRYTPNGADALIPGCPCEGWGIADATSRVSGYANRAMGTRGLEVESFKPDSSSATSVVKAGSTFRVTHQYIPAPETPNLYAITVTVENISGNTVDARYRRVMDWDVPPKVFYEYVTNNNGDSPAVLYMSDNGFASADPLSGPSRLYRDGDMVDAGPGDIGALFDFKLGPIEPGKKTSFKIYYGAGPDEATMTGALKKVKAEAYSLGEPSVDPTQGKPNTFAFGFKRSAGRSYVAIGDSTTTGHSVKDCLLVENSYNYPYGCPKEPGDGPAYPDLLAKVLGPPYNNGYNVAEPGDYQSNKTLGPPGAEFNRVGVWGYTIKKAVEDYRGGGDPDRRDGTNWESQLHAVDDAQDLVTVSLGANDMQFAKVEKWLPQAAIFNTQGYANELLRELNKPQPNGDPSYMDQLFEPLKRAQGRGVTVVVALYYNPFHEPYTPPGNLSFGNILPKKCAVTYGISEDILNTINNELRQRAEERGFLVADFKTKFNPPGDEDHGAEGPDPKESWVYGSECDLDGIVAGYRPASWNPFDENYRKGVEQGIKEEFDPHPNPAGSAAMADEIKEVLGR